MARGGRPESEIDTPVNIENRLYCDNGEGVAVTPLPYPLRVRGCPEVQGFNARNKFWGILSPRGTSGERTEERGFPSMTKKPKLDLTRI